MGKIADNLIPLLEQASGTTAMTLANRLEKALGSKKKSTSDKTPGWRMFSFQLAPDDIPKAVGALKDVNARMGTNPMLSSNVDEYIVGNVRVHVVHNKGGNSLSYVEVGEPRTAIGSPLGSPLPQYA